MMLELATGCRLLQLLTRLAWKLPNPECIFIVEALSCGFLPIFVPFL
jgi:hypothetical protein